MKYSQIEHKFTLNYISILILSFMLFSCHYNQTEDFNTIITDSAKALNVKLDTSSTSNLNKITFDCIAKSYQSSEKKIEITAALYNNNPDTIYFLSSSCDGEIYLLKHDTSYFSLVPQINCNASYPEIKKIEPNGNFEFKAYLNCIKESPTISLAFDLTLIDKMSTPKDIKIKNIKYYKQRKFCYLNTN